MKPKKATGEPHRTIGGHLTAAEIFRFGLWMTLAAYLVVLFVALPYWAAIGEPLRLISRG